MLFHICNKSELISCSDDVVLIICCSEINITLKVVCKESHTAFEGHKLSAEGKIIKYQQPITWKFSLEAPIPGNPDRLDTYLTVNESTYFTIDDAVRKYISAEKQVIGVSFNYVMSNFTMTGFFDDYDLDQLKAEYTDPQP